MAEHAIAMEAARSLYQKAARKSDTRGSGEPEAAMANVTGSHVAVDVAPRRDPGARGVRVRSPADRQG
jgi:alkylation response protein AidB-like acyl-CoA dehydrogenase